VTRPRTLHCLAAAGLIAASLHVGAQRTEKVAHIGLLCTVRCDGRALDALRDGLRSTARERALLRWARQLVRDPNGTTADDVESMRKAGLVESEIFEATVFIAFRLAFSTVNDALGAQPDSQLADAAPAEVWRAVTYGRPIGN
jgi:alkylhydroperoxidase family enzyme